MEWRRFGNFGVRTALITVLDLRLKKTAVVAVQPLSTRFIRCHLFGMTTALVKRHGTVRTV